MGVGAPTSPPRRSTCPTTADTARGNGHKFVHPTRWVGSARDHAHHPLAPLANAIHQVERLRRLHATEPAHPAVLIVYRRAMRTEAVPLEASRLQAVDHHLDERALTQHGVHVVALPDPCDLGQHDPALRLVLDDPRGRRQVGT